MPKRSSWLPEGVKELVVIAQDTVPLWNRFVWPPADLGSARTELNAIDGLHWIRVLYLYPDEIDDEFVTGIKDLKKVIPYFDIPVQHGSDKMLEADEPPQGHAWKAFCGLSS